jgi:sugar/nucleoside kinase (ribokinase family)
MSGFKWKMTSKKYDIFGIGAALFDLEYKVEASFFEKANIQKGVRTLVSASEQTRIINRLHDEGYSPSLSEGGGSAANSLTCANALGSDVYFCCKVASDYSGSLYLADLEAKKIDLNKSVMLEGDEAHTSGRCLALITSDADRTMVTSLGVSNNYEIGDIDLDALHASKYVFIEGYLLAIPEAKNICEYLQAQAIKFGVKVILTLSDQRLVQQNKIVFDEYIRSGVDIIIGNIEEALELTGSETHSAAITAMMAYQTSYAITLGADGVAIYNGGVIHFIKARACDCIDIFGAGDGFAGAFTHGMAQGMRWRDAAHLANVCASTIVSREGPRIKQTEATQILEVFSEKALQ